MLFESTNVGLLFMMETTNMALRRRLGEEVDRLKEQLVLRVGEAREGWDQDFSVLYI